MRILVTFAAMAFSVAALAAPNVILVMTDDQGYGDLSCHGNTELQTPNLDRLHAESVRFTDFHVSPTCSPTRAALMTGRYNDRVSVWHTIMGRSILPGNEVTLAEALRDAGYRTGMFGKWHLGDNYPSRAMDQGFEATVIHGGGGVGQLPDYWGNDYFDDTYFRNGKPEQFNGYCTDVWFDEALKFIEQASEKPFFCYLATNAPHGPYNVADEYKQKYLDAGIEEPRASFYGMIENIDDNMGKLLDRLDALNIADDTILIFMTDNGTAAGFRDGNGYNAGMRGTKGSPYEGGHRVPFFIRWPNGIPTGGRDISYLSAHIDVMPTILDLCEIDPPTGVEFDGASLKPQMTSLGDWLDRTIITDSQRIEYPEKWRQSAVMFQRLRLVNGKELYDVNADPGQTANIASEHPETVARMRADYEKWWESIAPGFDTFPRIVVGGEAPDTVTLTSHDWHGANVPWNQNHVRKGEPWNGTWKLEIAEPGTYQFALYRWPPHLNVPIVQGIENGTALFIKEAQLVMGGYIDAAPVNLTDVRIPFQVALNEGQYDLNTIFIDDDGVERGAYFVVIEKVE